MKKPRYKQHLIEGEWYTIRQLVLKTGISHGKIKTKIFNENATTFQELRAKSKNIKSINFHRSMYADKHGHWKLLSKALGC